MSDGESQATPEQVKEARENGWTPREQWKGPEDKWVDADVFLERGEHILPIVRANLRRAQDESLTKAKEIDSLKESLREAQEAIKGIQKANKETTQLQVKQALINLRDQLKAAREANDVDAEFAILDKIDDLKDAKKKADEGGEEKEEKVEKKETFKLDPVVAEWMKENTWFGDLKDKEHRKMTREMYRIAEDLREEGVMDVGAPFLEQCYSVFKERQKSKSSKEEDTPNVSKVKGSTPGSSSKSGRAFNNLPKEAKEVCWEDNETFVGPGKMFKSQAEWEDYYASLYKE